MQYKECIKQEMDKLAKKRNSIFLGQQVAVNDFYGTLTDVPLKKRLEMPVAEELQMGMSIGMAISGYLPITIYQRMDFLPRAYDQMINHLDLLNEYSRGKFNPRVIIRTTVGSNNPLDVGMQHNKLIHFHFNNIEVLYLLTAQDIKRAFHKPHSVLTIEFQDLYDTTI